MHLKTKWVEVISLHEMMVYYRGNISMAARDLGINRASLRKYLESDEERLAKVIRNDDSSINKFELINKRGND